MTEKKRRVTDKDASDRLSKLTTELLYLTSSMLESKDIPSFAQVSKAFRTGWILTKLIIEAKGAAQKLNAVADAIGDRVDRVRFLDLTFGAAVPSIDDVGDAVVRFRGLRRITVNEWLRWASDTGQAAAFLSRALRTRRLVNLRNLALVGVKDSDGVVLKAIRDTHDSHTALVAVQLSCEPFLLVQGATEWLARLRYLRLVSVGAFDSGSLTAILRACSVLEQFHYLAQPANDKLVFFSDDWAAATFDGTTSKNIEIIDLNVPVCGLTPAGLQTIANHCKAMKRLAVVSSADDKSPHRWDDMIPVLRTWSSTLQSIRFECLVLDNITATFLEQTRDLCPQVKDFQLQIGFSWDAQPAFKLPESVKTSGLVASWRAAHPLVTYSPFYERETSTGI